jgi:NAD(P)-dependent dehydrogenase (short-subunit alcohol dehydrogenase family)
VSNILFFYHELKHNAIKEINMDLQGQFALVTGAAQGIGAAIAKAYLQQGAKVMLADISPDVEKTALHLSAYGETRFCLCDVGYKTSVTRLFQEAAAWGKLDILVNNAGILHAVDFLELEEEDFERVLRVNLKGAFLCGQAAAKAFISAKKTGNIINMSSVNALLAIPNQTAYNVSKGGLKQLTNNMALSLAPHNIRVNAIGPGSINTAMMQTLLTDEAARNKILSRTPLGRLGEVKEIAEIAVFLASEKSSYITGQTIYADGGRLGLNYTVAVKV